MPQTAVITTKIESRLRDDVNIIFKALGLSTNEAITLFFKMVKKNNGLPFKIDEIPNEETLLAIEEVKQGKDLVVCKDVDDLFRKLNI